MKPQIYEKSSCCGKNFTAPLFTPPFTPKLGQNFAPSVTPTLDKLAQLRKRTRSKYITNGIVNRLKSVRNTSLYKSYLNTFFCCGNLCQKGQVLTSIFCNNRFCLICNRIRTAKLMNGYLKPLKKLFDKQFVTLTIPNCSDEELPKKIDTMIKTFRKCQNSLRMNKVLIRALRKLECTYNHKSNTYHPHFHVIIQGESEGLRLIAAWLKHFSDAKKVAQHIRPADDNSIKELFKYFTKLFTKDHFYPEAMDVIFRAMYGRRVFQPCGIKKDVSEEIDDIQSQTYEFLTPADKVWKWNDSATDWVDEETGECLTGYTPSQADKKLVENIMSG